MAGIHIDSRLWSRDANPKMSNITETARIELTQLYDFEEEAWRDIRVEGKLGQPAPWTISLDSYYSWEESEWTKFSSLVGYSFDKHASASLNYRYNSGNIRAPFYDFDTVENESVGGNLTLKPGDRNQFIYQAHYSFQYNHLVWQSVRWDYFARQRCWGMTAIIKDRLRPLEPDKHEISASFNIVLQNPIK